MKQTFDKSVQDFALQKRHGNYSQICFVVKRIQNIWTLYEATDGLHLILDKNLCLESYPRNQVHVHAIRFRVNEVKAPKLADFALEPY